MIFLKLLKINHVNITEQTILNTTKIILILSIQSQFILRNFKKKKF
jgi:hypothetical protein